MNEHKEPGTRTSQILTQLAVFSFAVVGLVVQRRAEPASAAVVTGSAKQSPGPAGSMRTEPATVEHKPGLIGIGKAVVERIGKDNITLVAAGIAFYIMGAIFPALAALVSVYGLVADPHQVAERISELGGMLPPEALKIITDGLNSFAQKSGSQLSFALLTSLVLALWTARAGMTSIMTGLNIAYRETEKRSFIMQNMIALGLTLGGVVFAAVAIFAVAIIPAALAFLHATGFVAQLLNIARWPVLAVMVVLAFAVMYRYAPSRSHASWKWITWGSGIAAVLWIIGSVLFSFYVGHFGSYDATYGALGAVIILLLWFWVSATVLLVGAEIDAEVDARATKAGDPLAPLPAGAAAP